MSGECMYFEKNWKEFLESYSFVDQKEIYTNGARLIQTLRVKQMVDHYFKNANTQQWIPCSERLPKQGEQVICTLVSARGHRFVTQEQFFPNLLKEPFPMVAWMPLPEPYREDGKIDGKN